MAIPDFQSIMLPLLELGRGQPSPSGPRCCRFSCARVRPNGRREAGTHSQWPSVEIPQQCDVGPNLHEESWSSGGSQPWTVSVFVYGVIHQ